MQKLWDSDLPRLRRPVYHWLLQVCRRMNTERGWQGAGIEAAPSAIPRQDLAGTAEIPGRFFSTLVVINHACSKPSY